MQRWATRRGSPSWTSSRSAIARRRSCARDSTSRRTSWPTTSTSSSRPASSHVIARPATGVASTCRWYEGPSVGCRSVGSRAPSDVLFLCTQNSARSQLAAALWTARTGCRASSAGTAPAARVHRGAAAAARRAGLSLADAVPRQLESLPDGVQVVTVCDRVHEELAARPDWWHWSIPDPVDGGIGSGLRCRRPRTRRPHRIAVTSDVGDGSMTVRIGINGFGRMGRLVVRALRQHPDLELVHVNEITRAASRWPRICSSSTPSTVGSPARSAVDGRPVWSSTGSPVGFSEHASPSDIPWSELGVDVVIESTGRFKTAADTGTPTSTTVPEASSSPAR